MGRSTKYPEIYKLKDPLPDRWLKRFVDYIVGLCAFLLSSPIWITIILAQWIDGWIHSQHRGSIMSAYVASNRGTKFMKYKFRVAQEQFINQKLKKEGHIEAYPSENDPTKLTCVGKFLKKHYLDEMAQVFNLVKGDIGLVGPRPYSWKHYVIDLEQGNVTRKLVRAGIFSQTHVRKGTPAQYDVELENEYAHKYRTASALSLLWLDMSIILRGIGMVVRGEKRNGHSKLGK